MNRRSFFTSLSSAVAGIYIACHVNLGRLTESVSEAVKPAAVGINPAWVDAPYEVGFLFSPTQLPNEIFTKQNATVFSRKDVVEGRENRRLVSSGDYPMRLDANRNQVTPFVEL